MVNKNGYVYLICDPANNVFKIGVTRNLNSKRIKKLQTGNPTELHITSLYEAQWPFRLETMLHTKYKNKQILNEWFELELCDVVNFKQTCKDLENIIESLLENPFFSKNLK